MSNPLLEKYLTKPEENAIVTTLGYGERILRFNIEGLRKLSFNLPIDESSYSYLYNNLNYLDALSHEPINITMCTNGGNIVSGLAMYDLIKDITKTTPVHITTHGACMSMGVIVLQSATKRLSSKNTQFMLHELQGGNFGDLSEMRDRFKHVNYLQETLNKILSERSGLNSKEINDLIERKESYISSEEALKYNFIDEIV